MHFEAKTRNCLYVDKAWIQGMCVVLMHFEAETRNCLYVDKAWIQGMCVVRVHMHTPPLCSHISPPNRNLNFGVIHTVSLNDMAMV